MRKPIIYFLYYLHFPLWIIKDSSWFLSLNYEAFNFLRYASASFAIITLIISTILLKNSDDRLSYFENLILTIWLLANTSWMLHEMFYVSFAKNIALISFLLGIALIPFYMVIVFKIGKIKFK